MVIVSTLILIVVVVLSARVRVLLVLVCPGKFSIFRVTLLEEWSFAVFLLILDIRNSMALLRRTTWHISTKLLLLHSQDFNVIIHLYWCLLHLVVRIIILPLIVDRVSLTTICQTPSFIV